jgi:hypothetical protein
VPRFLFLFSSYLLFLQVNSQLPALIPYNHNGVWGYADSTGKIRIKPQWDRVSFFYPTGLAWVEKGIRVKLKGPDVQRGFYTTTQRGFIDSNGKLVIPLNRVMAMEEYVPNSTYFNLELQESIHSLFDNKGRLLCNDCVQKDSLYAINRVIFKSRWNRYGLKDKYGKVRAHARYKRIDEITETEVRENMFYVYGKGKIQADSEHVELLNFSYPLWEISLGKAHKKLIDSNGNTVVKWSIYSKNIYVEPYDIHRIKGEYIGDKLRQIPIQYADSSQLYFVASGKKYSCQEIYQMMNQNTGRYDKIAALFRQPNFYITDKYGRKYVKK